MPKETALPSEIQLLPKERIEKEPLSQFLQWALTFGRYIIIFTEGIVLIVFLSRFWLDSQIIDLKQIITQKAQIVQSAESFEREFLEVQAKMDKIQTLQKELFTGSRYFTIIEETIPQEAVLTKFSVNQDGINIQGTTNSYDVVTAFVYALKNREEFVEANLVSLGREQLEEGTEGAIVFVVKAAWEEEILLEESNIPPVGK